MTKTLTVDGMNCGHCVNAVRKALEQLEEVKSAVVNLEEGTALVELKSEIADSALVQAVKDAGYGVESIE